MISLKRKKKNKLENETRTDETTKLDLSVEKLALSNTISIEALIEVLAKKGLIDKKEVLDEVRNIGRNSKLL
jgi:hypothetical protein